MSKAMEDVARDAAQLPRQQRLALARFLLELDVSTSPEGAESQWEAEIRDRVQTVESGQARALPYADVLARIDRRLGP